MKKIIILVVLWFVLFGDFGKILPIPKPKVNVNDFISDFEAMGYAGLFHMMPKVGADEVVPPKPDDKVVSECKCNKSTGKISYDGGTSLTDCPCKIGECNCGCVNSKKQVKASVERNYADLYYILKVTSPSCGPCRVWDATIRPQFNAAGIKIADIDTSKPTNLPSQAHVQYMPHFIVASRVDTLFHYTDETRKEVVGYYQGSDFNLEKAYELMAKLDRHLHPKIEEGVFYDRQQKSQTMLNNKFFATKKEYIEHLTSNTNHIDDVVGWPLVELSPYELKAIHDDDHAEKLGVLNGL